MVSDNFRDIDWLSAFSAGEATPNDVVAYLRGVATPEQTRRLKSTLKDPVSELNAWLRDVEEWAQETLPPTKPVGTSQIGESRHGATIQAHQSVLMFIRAKRRQRVFTDADVNRITAAAELPKDSATRLTPSESILAASRMLEVIERVHPELVSEVDKLTPKRHR